MTSENKQSSPTPPTEDKLVDGYRKMVERVRGLLEKAGEQSRPMIEEMLETARAKADELGELTREESQKIADYLRRDLRNAADYLASSEKDISDWLQFDMQLIEDWIMEAFSAVADQTRIDMIRLNEQLAARNVVYRTGEITGPGTLRCDECAEPIVLKRTARIPPCPKCHKTEFHRQF